LAIQELDYRWPEQSESIRAYISVIVTTAKLFVASYDPNTISLADGTMPEAKFEQVPFIRFRKQLGWNAAKVIKPTAAQPNSIADARENTVFVVNAEGLMDFLQDFELDGASVDRHMGPKR
jgi:hypothetical protein